MQKLAKMNLEEIVNGGDVYIVSKLNVLFKFTTAYYLNALTVLARVPAVSTARAAFDSLLDNLKIAYANNALLGVKNQEQLPALTAFLIAQHADFNNAQKMLGALRLGLLSNPECRAAILAY